MRLPSLLLLALSTLIFAAANPGPQFEALAAAVGVLNNAGADSISNTRPSSTSSPSPKAEKYRRQAPPLPSNLNPADINLPVGASLPTEDIAAATSVSGPQKHRRQAQEDNAAEAPTARRTSTITTTITAAERKVRRTEAPKASDGPKVYGDGGNGHEKMHDGFPTQVYGDIHHEAKSNHAPKGYGHVDEAHHKIHEVSSAQGHGDVYHGEVHHEDVDDHGYHHENHEHHEGKEEEHMQYGEHQEGKEYQKNKHRCPAGYDKVEEEDLRTHEGHVVYMARERVRRSKMDKTKNRRA